MMMMIQLFENYIVIRIMICSGHSEESSEMCYVICCLNFNYSINALFLQKHELTVAVDV